MPDGRDELSATLRRLRADADLSGTEAGKRAGLSQASISRYEHGKFVPSPDDVDALTGVYHAPDGVRRRLRQLASDLREDVQPPARLVISRGASQMQQRVARVEASSVHIRHFHPIAVAGLLQIPDYARAVFASGGDLPPEQVEQALAARMERQRLLDDAGREFTFVLTEGVLRWQVAGPAVMVAQLDHLTMVSRFPHVRLGVVPWTTTVRVAPMHGFDVYDQRAVIVGTETATAFLTNPHDVAAYLKLFADVEAVAAFAGQARQVLTQATRDYRTLL